MKRLVLVFTVVAVLLSATSAFAAPWYKVELVKNEQGQVVQKFVVGQTENKDGQPQKCRVFGSYRAGTIGEFSTRSTPTFRVEIPKNAETVGGS